MARLFDDASSQYLEVDDVPLTGMPFTIACWFKIDDLAVHCGMVYLGYAAVGDHYYIMAIDEGELRIRSRDGSADASAFPSASPSIDTWTHACGVWASATSRIAYLDGTAKVEDTTSVSPNAATRTAVGRYADSTPGNYMSGAVAHLAIWSVALGDSDVAALAAGALPTDVQSGNLVAYWPFVDDDVDDIDSLTLTPYNSPTFVAGPDLGGEDNLEADSLITGAPTFDTPTAAQVYPVGETAWGHVTSVLEDNVRTFSGHWTGTGTITGSGDAEKVQLASGEYLESEIILTGTGDVTLLQNVYSSGDTVTMKYRHGASQSACTGASWLSYSAPFTSLGFVQVRLESTL